MQHCSISDQRSTQQLPRSGREITDMTYGGFLCFKGSPTKSRRSSRRDTQLHGASRTSSRTLYLRPHPARATTTRSHANYGDTHKRTSNPRRRLSDLGNSARLSAIPTHNHRSKSSEWSKSTAQTGESDDGVVSARISDRLPISWTSELPIRAGSGMKRAGSRGKSTTGVHPLQPRNPSRRTTTGQNPRRRSSRTTFRQDPRDTADPPRRPAAQPPHDSDDDQENHGGGTHPANDPRPHRGKIPDTQHTTPSSIHKDRELPGKAASAGPAVYDLFVGPLGLALSFDTPVPITDMHDCRSERVQFCAFCGISTISTSDGEPPSCFRDSLHGVFRPVNVIPPSKKSQAGAKKSQVGAEKEDSSNPIGMRYKREGGSEITYMFMSSLMYHEMIAEGKLEGEEVKGTER